MVPASPRRFNWVSRLAASIKPQPNILSEIWADLRGLPMAFLSLFIGEGCEVTCDKQNHTAGLSQIEFVDIFFPPNAPENILMHYIVQVQDTFAE